MTKPLVWGLLLASFLTTLFPPGFLGRLIPHGPLQYLVLLLAGMPIYMCSTGSLPLAFSLYLQGFSPGSLLVFLLSGPATNVTSLVVIRKVLGGRIFVLYTVSLVIFALLAGVLFDLLGAKLAFRLPQERESLSWVHYIMAFVLGLLLLWHLCRSFKARPSCASKGEHVSKGS